MKGINGGHKRRVEEEMEIRVQLDVAYPFPRQWLEVSTRGKRIEYLLPVPSSYSNSRMSTVKMGFSYSLC